MNLKKFFGTAVMLGILSTTAQAHVLDGATELNGHYYKAFEFMMIWNQAEKFCESMGGHLATAESFDENAIIQSVVDLGTRDRWYMIGGYSTDTGIWKWVTGGIITDQNWAYNEPRFSKMHMVKKGESRWRTSSDTNPFICEWDSRSDAHDSDW